MNTQDTAMTSIGKMQNIQNLLSKIVGPEFILTSLEEREKHSKVTLPYKKVCSVVVNPASVDEVQKIILLANEFNFKIWPFSRGNNWGYGTKNSLEEDSIIIILERMNKIIEVNEELAYVVVEPGVSQKQLNDYLKEKNLNFGWIAQTLHPMEAFWEMQLNEGMDTLLMVITLGTCVEWKWFYQRVKL